jgi:ABC-type bacteriocin/lantibiotic exporter with double-glycine peptidase domain
VRKLHPQELRRRFGVVLQDSYLFTGALEDNIRLGNQGIGREAWRRPPNR